MLSEINPQPLQRIQDGACTQSPSGVRIWLALSTRSWAQGRAYLSGARCFFSQPRSSSAGLVSARGLALCRSESQKPKKDLSMPTPALPGASWHCDFREDQTSCLSPSPLQSHELPSKAWPALSPLRVHVASYQAQSQIYAFAYTGLPSGIPPFPFPRGLYLQGPSLRPFSTASSCPWYLGLSPPSQADLGPPHLSHSGHRPVGLTGVVEKDAPLALAPIRGHSELHPQCLA